MVLDLSALDRDESPVVMQAAGVPGRASLGDFEEDPGNPRFEEDAELFGQLVDDIRERGILQPIVVLRQSGGKLRIRFGSQRYRAALALGLNEAPYVVTEDARQFDDYAQVAENERRRSLQPLELATFIARKLAAGEKKKVIAARLGLSPSAVTYLLSLVGDPPGFISDLYHSRRCRSPQYLYELRRLWDSMPAVVERLCAEATEINRGTIEGIVQAVAPPALQPASPSSAANEVTAASVSVGSQAPDESVAGAASTAPPGSAAAGQARVGAERSRGRQIKPDALVRIQTPQLLATYCGRKVTIELTFAASGAGEIVVRDASGELWEVPIHAVRLTSLRECEP